ncbi:peptidoglycan-binding protein [Sphingomonas sp. GC_Shp_3]|uniref:peptidoglycan-binding protein n=1 Tax=Sphingomonas sp. GC_Shp_3 TaxID=2937383 RepID=UPI0022699CCC|nr:peptidoglycan-binding protein [Sphingomonas sp. GC_Shp_3]
MSHRIDAATVAATHVQREARARAIYAEAQSQITSRLWQAAIGGEDGVTSAVADAPPLARGFEAMLARFDRSSAMVSGPIAQAAVAKQTASVPSDDPAPANIDGLGANERHRTSLEKASVRSGIPAASLASIIDAEAAKGSDGRWNVYSRNPRSSAAGLGQFISGTWVGMAEQAGSFLHSVAQRNGWLCASGKVLPEARAKVLALRYDAEASIQTIADYSRCNLDTLKKCGITVGNSVEEISKTAYLAHYMGPRDAAKFLRGQLDSGRARTLLAAQIGTAKAGRDIAAAGNAADAHRMWLASHVSRNVRPARYVLSGVKATTLQS